MSYKYNIRTGATRIRTKIQTSKIVTGLVALAMPVAIVLSSGAASAAPPAFGLQPGAFGQDVCPGIVGQWDNTTGNPAPSIFLNKPCATTTFAASYVDIITPLEGGPVSALHELNYDYQNGGHCGAGAPRFNIETNQGTVITLGCIYGTQTPTSNPNWTHVEFDQAKITAALLGAGINPATATLTDLYILFDEGSDTPSGGTIGTPGQINIDNISVNGSVVGSPTSPTTKEDCKKGGWQNFNPTFKNQGDCVSFVATGGKNHPSGQ
jgi:hypothetical protein